MKEIEIFKRSVQNILSNYARETLRSTEILLSSSLQSSNKMILEENSSEAVGCVFDRAEAERERDNRHDLQSRVDGFLEQLKSSKEEDVEVNAHVLAEIMRNFSSTFGVSNDKITTLLSQEDGGVNVEELRKKLVAQGQ
jgi:hypothetical protein